MAAGALAAACSCSKTIYGILRLWRRPVPSLFSGWAVPPWKSEPPGGYQPEVADDVQIQLAVGTGLRGVKDLNAAQAGLLQLADDVVENVRLEFCVYRVRHNRGGAVAADEVYNLRGGAGRFSTKAMPPRAKTTLYASSVFWI